MDHKKITAIQEKRLRAIVKYAVENSRFWREHFERAKLSPAGISTLKDLEKIPFISKPDLVSRPLEDRITIPLDECVQMATSGTTGASMLVYYDKKFVRKTGMMLMFRTPRWHGLPRVYKSVRIMYDSSADERRKDIPNTGASRPQSVRREKILGQGSSFLGRIYDRYHKQAYVANEIGDVTREIIRVKPAMIMGNTSYLRMLVEYLKENGNQGIHPLCTLATGEPFDEPTRVQIESALNCDAYQLYGSNELGPLAIECGEKKGLHIFSERAIIEITSPRGEILPPGELGEIVVTGLLNQAMPLIRYRTGDIGCISDRRCECGRNLPVLETIEGRAIDHLATSFGRVSPKRVAALMHMVEGLPRCQLIQESEDSFKLRVFKMSNSANTVNAVEEFIKLLKSELGSVTILVSIEEPDRLRAKFRPVISERTVAIDNRWIVPY